MSDMIQTGLAVLAIIASGIAFIYRKGMSDKDLQRAINSIKTSRLKCRDDRSEQMRKIEERLTILESTDINHDLIILEIKKDLEQLSEKITTHHTTTQLMMSQLSEHQQEMNKSLIETIRDSMTKNV